DLAAKAETLTINGLQAARAVFPADSKAHLELTWIAHGGLIFQLVAVASADRFNDLQPAFKSVAGSFRPSSASERAGITEQLLRFRPGKFFIDQILWALYKNSKSGPGSAYRVSNSPRFNIMSSLIACRECDLLQREIVLPPGGTACCSRCGAILHRSKPDSLDRTLAFMVGAAVLFILANVFPVVGLEAQGNRTST